MSNRTLIKQGYLLTLEEEGLDDGRGDMLIEGDTIRAIDESLEAPEAEVVDASDHIVMPGFVDTHRHTWEAVIRNIGADWTLTEYLNHIYYGGLGGAFRPEDVYTGNLLGALEALDSGVTTILDWSMVNTPDHADRLIRGLKDSGIRAVFGHGTPTRNSAEYWNEESDLNHPEDCRRVQEEYFSDNENGLVRLGLAIRGPEFSSWETAMNDLELARDLDVLCTIHAGFGTWGREARTIQRLNEADLLGPDLNFVHVNDISPEEYKLLADSGGSLSVTPEIELMMGHGYPPTGTFIEQGGRPCLGVDVVTSISGEMFTPMRFMLQAERARNNGQQLEAGEMPETLDLKARDVLEFATVEGARALNMEDEIGSLEPGKQADFIMLRATDSNLWPVNDPVGAVVQSANTGNVEHVYVAGQAVKRDGELVGVDWEEIRARANDSRDYVLTEYGELDDLTTA